MCNWNINSLVHESNKRSDDIIPNGFIANFYHSIIQAVFYNPNRVLRSISYSKVAIFEDFALLSIYGIISPLCAVAIGTGLVTKITILRVSIVRYYRLHDDPVVGGARLDTLCGVALQHTEALFWPSFMAATLFFGFFLWDMTSDSDEPAGPTPWVFLTMTLSAVMAIRVMSSSRYFSSYFLQSSSSPTAAVRSCHDQQEEVGGIEIETAADCNKEQQQPRGGSSDVEIVTRGREDAKNPLHDV